MIRSARVRRACVGALGCAIVYGLAGFFVVPPIVRSQAERRLSAALGRDVSIGKVRIDPYMLSVTVEDFDIREKAADRSFLGWGRLYVRFDAMRSLAGDWVIGDVELDGFHAAVVVNPGGSFNFSDLLGRLPGPTVPAAGAKPGRAVRVGSLRVNLARVDFSDQSLRRPFAASVGPLSFTLAGFRTAGSRGAPYHFEAVTDAGERLAWSGTLAADPVQSRGQFEVENLVLKRYMPYAEGRVRAVLADGRLSVRGLYEADLDPAARTLALRDAEVHLRGLRVLESAAGVQALSLDAFDVTGVQADAVAMKASAARVALAGGRLAVRREKDGSLNLISMLAGSGPAVGGAPAAPAGRPPEASVGEIALKDFSVDIDDEAIAHPARLSLSGLQFTLANFSSTGSAGMPMSASFDWAPKGKVQVSGTLALRPAVGADLKAEVTGLEILPVSPYLEQFVNARITQGSVTVSGSVKASLASGEPAVAVAGDLAVDKLGLVDAARDKELAGFERLVVSGVTASTGQPLSISVGKVELVRPYARVRVDQDGSLNVAAIARASPPDHEAGQGPAAKAAPAPRIVVGSVAITGGDFSFADHSVDPNVHVALKDFSGTVTGLSSENLARGDVSLLGKVDGEAPVEISGKLDPLGAHRYVGLKIDVRNLDLVPLSPYSGRFAGYELARGQLVVDSKVLVDGDSVDATNVVTLNQFTFGSPTASPSATKLPVRLGVALLKDLDGRIVIDLPVQGSLADPEFRVGRVVMRVVVNLLTKAAVSPFSLLGSMFGGGGEELAYQEFAPGSSALQDSELPKLATLAKALANRPALNLGVVGSYDSAADAYALKRLKLASLVRARVWEERRAADPNLPPPDQIQVSADENAAMVKRLFDAKFPPGTKFGAPLPPAPEAKAAPAKPPPGLLRRIVNFVTLEKMRDEKAERKQDERLASEHAKAVAQAEAAGLPLEEMTGRLAESMDVSADDLRSLAAARALSVRNRLVDAYHIGAGRLFLTQSPDPSKQDSGPRAVMDLQ